MADTALKAGNRGVNQKIEQHSVSQLVPYARNARTHSPEQIEQLAASIREFGFTIPVLVDEAGTIIAGHGRVLAAKALGMEQVPVLVARGWTEEQRRAYVLADNKLALNSGWDTDILKLELGELGEMGLDLGLTGFSIPEMADLFGSDAPPTDPAAEWVGMPEFSQEAQDSFRRIVVHFKDQPAVDSFVELMGQKITANTKYIWHPQIEVVNAADKQYLTEQEKADEARATAPAASE